MFTSLIKSLGFRVFVRTSDNPTYCFFTDGDRIGYAQWSDFRQSVSSVHKPSTVNGTGFQVAEEITKASLDAALSTIVPIWARGDVKKYKNMDAYLNASKWNSELIEV